MKIDTSKIEGFASMTAEQKLEAMQNYEMPDPDYSGYVSKATFDNTASELAKLKKEHNSLLSAEEQKKQADKEMLEGLQNELKTLRKEKTISEHKSKLIALGYDEALATETATAMADGDMQKVFDNQRKFLEKHDQTTKETLLKGTPAPAHGTGGAAVDYAKKIEEANRAGDYTSVAYYMRLQQEASKQK